MDQQDNYRHYSGFIKPWMDCLRATARELQLGYEPVLVRGWFNGSDIITAVRQLGGSVTPTADFHGWKLGREDRRPPKGIERFAPELRVDGVHLGDFHGIVLIDLDGQRYLAMRTDEQGFPGNIFERLLILAGPTMEATLALAGRIKKAVWLANAGQQVEVWGSSMEADDSTRVDESDLVLPRELKHSLLHYVDGFWNAAGLCREMGIPATRGILFVGPPGTGKTHAVRHLFARYPTIRHLVFSPSVRGNGSLDDAFMLMLHTLGEGDMPAMVVLEDIDRMLENGGLSAHIFLNVLDGFFRPPQSVLWVATSNDPSGIEQNVLDRPGRFDRVFVFPRPAATERGALIRRFMRRTAAGELVEEIARDSDGLTGAHLRELCYGAMLAVRQESLDEATALRRELARVREQHERARAYDFDLDSRRRAGFVAIHET